MLSVVLTACASVEEASGGPVSSVLSSQSGAASSSAVLSVSESTHIKKELATNLSVDADVIMPKTGTGKADVLTAKFHSVDTDALLQKFFSGKTVKSHDEEDGDIYQAADGSFLNNSSGSFYFHDSEGPTIDYAFFMDSENIMDYNADKFSTTSDLPFESRKSVAEKIKKFLASFGVDAGENYTGYSLDHQTLKTQQDEYVRREKADEGSTKSFESDIKAGRIKLQKEWSEDDDCYFFVFSPEINGMPITRKIHGSPDNGTSVAGTDITVLYTKKGIMSLSANYLYEITGTETKDTKLIGADQVVDAIEEKYGSMILTDKTVITKINLNYIPVLADKSRKNFKLTPAWEVTVSQSYKKGDKSRSWDSTVFFDAETGKEIL